MAEIERGAVEGYLSSLPSPERKELERMMDIVLEEVPGALARMSYGIIVISVGRDLVGLGCHSRFCSLYVMSTALVKRMEEELKGYDVSGATIHFTPGRPLPRDLTVKILAGRLEEMGKR